MRRLMVFILFLSTSFHVAGQTGNRRVNGYGIIQFTKTIRDQTIGNNPWGIGAGLQVFLNTKTAFRPTAELSGDVYLENDKVLILNPSGDRLATITSISRLLVAPSVNVGRYLNFGLLAGPTFVNGDVLVTLKPYFLLFTNERQKVFFKLAYVQVYNRGWTIKEDFTSGSIALGVKLF